MALIWVLLKFVINGIIVWTRTGQQHGSGAEGWSSATIDLSAQANACYVLVQFRGTTGASFRSDMAIDNIKIEEPCAVDGGNASISETALCAAGTVDLNLVGHDGAGTIQWQQSLNGGIYTNIVGATSASHTTVSLSPTNTYSFRAEVTNGCVSHSDTVSVIVNSGGGTISTFPYSESFESGFWIVDQQFW